MKNLDIILKALAYIEDHLDQPIKIVNIADTVGFSLFHFIRVFNDMTHHSPKDYLLRRRLTEAAKQIRSTDRTMLDIALDHGFNSHETFTRAFKRMYYVSPSHYSPDDDRISLPPLNEDYLRSIHQQCLQPHPLTLHNIQLLGWIQPASENPFTSPAIWQALQCTAGDLCVPCTPCRYYHIPLPSMLSVSAAVHMNGLQVDALPPHLPDVWVAKTFDNLECAAFQYHGTSSDLQHMINYIHHTWLPKSGYQRSGTLTIYRCDVLPTAESLSCSILIPIQQHI